MNQANHHIRAPRANGDPTTRCERLVYWGLVALLFWAPLPLGSYRPWAVALIVIWVAVLGAVWSAGWALGQCTVRSWFYRGRLALALLALWAGLIALQLAPLPLAWVAQLSPGAAAVFEYPYASTGGALRDTFTLSVDPASTSRHLLLTLALVGYFALMLLVIGRTARLQQFARMAVASGVMCAVLAVYLHFTGASYVLFFESMTHEVAKAPFHNRNHLAAYLEICLALGIGLIVAEFEPVRLTTWKQRMVWLLQLLLSAKVRMRLLLIVLVIGLILTRSRMGNAAFFTALIAGGLVALLSLHARWKTILLFLGSMIILDVIVIGSWIGVEQVVKRMQQTAISSDTRKAHGLEEQSVEERTDQGASALASLTKFPVFGTGSGSFEAMYPQYKQPGYMLSLNHAHADYVEFLVESGVLGAGLLLALLLLTSGAALRTLRTSQSASGRGLALGSLIGIGATLMHATVEFALQIPAVALLFVVLLGVATLATGTRPPAQPAPGDP